MPAHRIRTLRPGRRRRVLVRTAVVTVVVLLAGWGLFLVDKVYAPQMDAPPDDVDVMVQLGGAAPPDYDAARSFAGAHHIPALVISEPTGSRWAQDRYCGPLEGVEVICFSPDPSTTRGEAQDFTALATKHGWRSAYVLGTGREHAERVRLYFSRCWDGELAVNKPPGRRPFLTHLKQSVYQTAGWIRAETDRSC